MNLPDSIQYKFHSVHSLFEPMHGYILSITFGNAIDLNSIGLVIENKNKSTALNLRFTRAFCPHFGQTFYPFLTQILQRYVFQLIITLLCTIFDQ